MTSKPTIKLQLRIRAFWGASYRRSRHEYVHRKTEGNVVRRARFYLPPVLFALSNPPLVSMFPFLLNVVKSTGQQMPRKPSEMTY